MQGFHVLRLLLSFWPRDQFIFIIFVFAIVIVAQVKQLIFKALLHLFVMKVKMWLITFIMVIVTAFKIITHNNKLVGQMVLHYF